MDNNLFQTIFDKYSHSVEGSEYKYLCEVDAPKAMNEFAIAFQKWCSDNDYWEKDGEWSIGKGEWTTEQGVLELFNNKQ